MIKKGRIAYCGQEATEALAKKTLTDKIGADYVEKAVTSQERSQMKRNMFLLCESRQHLAIPLLNAISSQWGMEYDKFRGTCDMIETLTYEKDRETNEWSRPPPTHPAALKPRVWVSRVVEFAIELELVKDEKGYIRDTGLVKWAEKMFGYGLPTFEEVFGKTVAPANAETLRSGPGTTRTSSEASRPNVPAWGVPDPEQA